MPTSSDKGSGPSSPSGSLPFARSLRQGAKLGLADTARLLMDNQRTLNMTAASNREARRQTEQLRAAQTAQAMAEIGLPAQAVPPSGGEADMGDINIDSPTQVHHHYPAKAVLWPWLVVGAAILSGGGLGAWAFTRPASSPAGPTGSGVPAAAAPAEFYQIDQTQNPDGSWTETGRRKVRLNPDGSVTEVP